MSASDLRDTGIRRLRYYTRDSELDCAQLAAALDCSSQALIVVDGFGRICIANVAAARLLGADGERLHHSYVQNHVAALDSEVSVLDQALEGRSAIDITLPDGRRAIATLSPLLDGRGQPTHACIALVPSRTAADAGFEAVGRLVAEVAHDINNQLSAALNYVFILRRRLSADPELAPHFEELQSTAWRAATLTSGLKLLGPKRSSDAELLNVAAVTEPLAPLLRRVAAGAQVELRLAHDLPSVRVARAHLEQLLVMLTIIAVRRARRRGKIILRTETKRPAAGGIAPALSGGITPALRGGAMSIGGGAMSVADGAPVVRVVWELYRMQEPHGLTLGSSPARSQGSLRRALERCRALPGHDGRRIWVDLPAAMPSSDQSGK